MPVSAEALWFATDAVDMRTGIDGLSLHVQQALGRPPCDGNPPTKRARPEVEFST